MIKDDAETLMLKIIEDKISMADTLKKRSRYDSLIYIKNIIDENNIDGDVVEIGVWKGGIAIYLASIFDNKRFWSIDSYEGFQKEADTVFKINNGYIYNDGILADKHFAENIKLNKKCSVQLELVKSNFRRYGFKIDDETSRIKFLKGYVKDTLYNNPNCPIEKIAVLRIDVDAYSAYLEILYSLYDKVVNGGIIILDDYPMLHIQKAIDDFSKERKIHINLRLPTTYEYFNLKEVNQKALYDKNHELLRGVWWIKGVDDMEYSF